VGLLAAAALLTMSFLVSTYSLQYFPPSRVLIVPQFVLALAVLACGWSCAGLASLAPPGTLAVRAFQLLICALLIGTPLWCMYETLQWRADAVWYAKLWDRRDQRLRATAQAGQSVVVLDPLPTDLVRLPHADLVIRPAIQPNDDQGIAAEAQFMGRFYGLESVRYSRAQYRPQEALPSEFWVRILNPESIPRGIGITWKAAIRR
jgi:hypothetical protein